MGVHQTFSNITVSRHLRNDKLLGLEVGQTSHANSAFIALGNVELWCSDGSKFSEASLMRASYELYFRNLGRFLGLEVRVLHITGHHRWSRKHATPNFHLIGLSNSSVQNVLKMNAHIL